MHNRHLPRVLGSLTVKVALALLVTTTPAEAFSLSDHDLSQAIDSAELSQAAYNPTQPFQYNGWQRIDSGTSASGLKWSLFERHVNGKRELTLAFAGTDVTDVRDWLTNVDQAIPNTRRSAIPPHQYREALAIAQRAVTAADRDANTSLVITGHSLGGGLAQYTAAKLGVRGVVFNAAALGLDTIRNLAPSYRDNPSRQILNISLRQDPVHDATGKLFASRHLGVQVVIDPAPALPGVSPIDLPLLAPDNVRDKLTRHDQRSMIASLKYEQAYGDIRRQVEARPLRGQPTDPVPSWWTEAHKNKPQAQLLAEAESLTSLARGAHKVLIVGQGPAADLMAHRMSKKLGPENVIRQAPTNQDFLMRRAQSVGGSHFRRPAQARPRRRHGRALCCAAQGRRTLCCDRQYDRHGAA